METTKGGAKVAAAPKLASSSTPGKPRVPSMVSSVVTEPARSSEPLKERSLVGAAVGAFVGARVDGMLGLVEGRAVGDSVGYGVGTGRAEHTIDKGRRRRRRRRARKERQRN